METEQMNVRVHSYKELATLYGISHRTLKNWLKPFEHEIGKKRGRYYTIRQVRIVFKRLGEPAEYDQAA